MSVAVTRLLSPLCISLLYRGCIMHGITVSSYHSTDIIWLEYVSCKIYKSKQNLIKICCICPLITS